MKVQDIKEAHDLAQHRAGLVESLERLERLEFMKGTSVGFRGIIVLLEQQGDSAAVQSLLLSLLRARLHEIDLRLQELGVDVKLRPKPDNVVGLKR